eukprot:s498_g28.t1
MEPPAGLALLTLPRLALQVGWRVLTEANTVLVIILLFWHQEWASATLGLVLTTASWTLCVIDVLLAQEPISPLDEAQRSWDSRNAGL